ncbi:hypothetical protein [Kingella oralis]
MKRSTLLASTAALLLSAGVAFAAGEAVKKQPKDDMPPPAHGDKNQGNRPHKAKGDKWAQRGGLPRGFEQLDLSEEQKAKIRNIMVQHRA